MLSPKYTVPTALDTNAWSSSIHTRTKRAKRGKGVWGQRPRNNLNPPYMASHHSFAVLSADVTV